MHKRGGFTLAELLIVVAVIAVLVAVAIPTFSGQLEKSRQGVDVANLRDAYAVAKLAVINQDAQDSDLYPYVRYADEDSDYYFWCKDETLTVCESADAPTEDDATMGKAQSETLSANTAQLPTEIEYKADPTLKKGSGTSTTRAGTVDRGILVQFKWESAKGAFKVEKVTFADAGVETNGAEAGLVVKLSKSSITGAGSTAWTTGADGTLPTLTVKYNGENQTLTDDYTVAAAVTDPESGVTLAELGLSNTFTVDGTPTAGKSGTVTLTITHIESSETKAVTLKVTIPAA